MANVVKKRNWAFVLYPESAPENWVERLQETGLPIAISPLHDKDLDEGGNGETFKKAHHHIILCYSGPTSWNVVKSLCDSLHQPIPQPLENVKGYYRYLTHKDNPEKAQYEERDIKSLNGFNILDFADLTRSEVLVIKQSVHNLIVDRGIKEYADLMEILLREGMHAEYDVASSNTIFFDRLITSRRHKAVDVYAKDSKSSLADNEINQFPYVDPDTGELL